MHSHRRSPARFRHRSNTPNGGRRPQHRNGGDHSRLGSNSFSNGRPRGGFQSLQSAEKLVEKYNTLAKEALSSGDKTLSENYFQHADHFMRIVFEKKTNREPDKNQTTSSSKITETPSAEPVKNMVDEPVKNIVDQNLQEKKD